MLNFLGFLSITVFGVDCMLTANAVLWWPVCDNCTLVSHRMTGRQGKARWVQNVRAQPRRPALYFAFLARKHWLDNAKSHCLAEEQYVAKRWKPTLDLTLLLICNDRYDFSICALSKIEHRITAASSPKRAAGHHNCMLAFAHSCKQLSRLLIRFTVVTMLFRNLAY